MLRNARAIQGPALWQGVITEIRKGSTGRVPISSSVLPSYKGIGTCILLLRASCIRSTSADGSQIPHPGDAHVRSWAPWREHRSVPPLQRWYRFVVDGGS